MNYITIYSNTTVQPLLWRKTSTHFWTQSIYMYTLLNTNYIHYRYQSRKDPNPFILYIFVLVKITDKGIWVIFCGYWYNSILVCRGLDNFVIFLMIVIPTPVKLSIKRFWNGDKKLNMRNKQWKWNLIIICIRKTKYNIELLTLPEHLSSFPVFSGARIARSLVLCVMFCR